MSTTLCHQPSSLSHWTAPGNNYPFSPVLNTLKLRPNVQVRLEKHVKFCLSNIPLVRFATTASTACQLQNHFCLPQLKCLSSSNCVIDKLTNVILNKQISNVCQTMIVRLAGALRYQAPKKVSSLVYCQYFFRFENS